MTKKFSFNASGRKLFATEEVLVKVLNSKYKVGAEAVSGQLVRDKMASVGNRKRKAVLVSLQAGERTTAFFKAVEEAKRVEANAKTVSKRVNRAKAVASTAKPLAKQVLIKSAGVKPAVPNKKATPKPVAVKPVVARG